MKYTAMLLALAGTATIGCSGLGKIDYMQVPRRAAWQKPDQVIQSLNIQPGARVADLGSGGGYFVSYLTDAVGAAGRVYAVDVDEEITRALEQKVEEDGHGNVEVVLGRYEDPLLPDDAIDLVLIVNTYHHIEDRPAYFARLRRDLKAGGRVVVIDPNADLTGLLSLFLHQGHETAVSDLHAEMERAGYRPSESFDFLPVQLFEVFVTSRTGD